MMLFHLALRRPNLLLLRIIRQTSSELQRRKRTQHFFLIKGNFIGDFDYTCAAQLGDFISTALTIVVLLQLRAS